MRLSRGVASARNVIASVVVAACLAGPTIAYAQAASADAVTSLARFYPTPLASQPYATEDPEVWMAKVRGLLHGAPAVLRQSLVGAQSADEFAEALGLLEQAKESKIKRFVGQSRFGSEGAGKVGVHAKALGGNDLTYRPVAPCRLIDSRKNRAAMPNPLVGNVAYNFKIYTPTNFDAWGGAATDCGVPNSTSVDAVALVISVLEEPASGRPDYSAYLGISDINNVATILSAVAVNFHRLQGISTMYVARASSSDNLYLAMPAGLHANVVIDIVGYFTVSEATALDCVNTAVTSQLIPTGLGYTVSPPNCPSGYTLTSTTCKLTAYANNVFLQASGPDDVSPGGGGCSWNNQSGGAVTAETAARCCRVPGISY